MLKDAKVRSTGYSMCATFRVFVHVIITWWFWRPV